MFGTKLLCEYIFVKLSHHFVYKYNPCETKHLSVLVHTTIILPYHWQLFNLALWKFFFAISIIFSLYGVTFVWYVEHLIRIQIQGNETYTYVHFCGYCTACISAVKEIIVHFLCYNMILMRIILFLWSYKQEQSALILQKCLILC